MKLKKVIAEKDDDINERELRYRIKMTEKDKIIEEIKGKNLHEEKTIGAQMEIGKEIETQTALTQSLNLLLKIQDG